jgi:acyl-coenzyme A synthetase/AMP-(fatty) acid ligase
VENVLRLHEDIQDCAVIGLPDPKWGERVVAVVQPRPGRAVDAAELKAFVKAHAGSVKTPKQIEVWPDLPRSRIGKVMKAEVRTMLASQSRSVEDGGAG